MIDKFTAHQHAFAAWIKSGYPGVCDATKDFILHIKQSDSDYGLWDHQIEAILRSIYSYEILKKKNILLNIVTGGGKTAIMAAIILWLKSVHNINKFLILVPNTIVRSRLLSDFKNGHIFEKFGLISSSNKLLLNELDVHTMQPGSQPQGILQSGIILANIQQLYMTNITGRRNLAYMDNFTDTLAVFNDEAHNTAASEYTNILQVLSKNCMFRLDTTATPDRADGAEPDSEMIFSYDVSQALRDHIIKSIVVYEPEVKLLQMTYTNLETGEKKNITELDDEFKAAENQLKPFQWILDPEPMKKQIAIALQRHREHQAVSKNKYKPVLFVVTMSIKEAQRAKKVLEERFKINTLVVTEESNDHDRDEALKMGTFESRYDAIVSVLMLREGWDVPEVSTILLLRKFFSPVYGQQVIGRGLRKITQKHTEHEVLSVVDHPRLNHDWLWKLVGVSKIRHDVSDTDIFHPEDNLSVRPIIQTLVRPENLIKIPDPEYPAVIDPDAILEKIPDDLADESWAEIIEQIDYDKLAWIIDRISIDTINVKDPQKKAVEIIDGISEYDFEISGQFPRDILEQKLKDDLLHECNILLHNAGYGSSLLSKLYRAILNHIEEKIFSHKVLKDAEYRDIEFARAIMPDIIKNFSVKIVAGIVGDAN